MSRGNLCQWVVNRDPKRTLRRIWASAIVWRWPAEIVAALTALIGGDAQPSL